MQYLWAAGRSANRRNACGGQLRHACALLPQGGPRAGRLRPWPACTLREPARNPASQGGPPSTAAALQHDAARDRPACTAPPQAPRPGRFICAVESPSVLESPFQVPVEALAALSAEDSEALVRRMINAEADSAGVSPDRIYDGGRIASNDAGVDFEVADAPRESASGLIGQGRTLYRVESSASIGAADVRGMLFRDNALGEPIRSCLGDGGTLVVVLTAWGGPNADEGGLEAKFSEELRRARAPCRGSVKVWAPARIAGLLGRHPHLALSASPVRAEGLCTYDEWSGSRDMSCAFRSGDGEADFVRRLRGHLLGDGPLHVRVTGEPGAGKTRMVLEALRDDRLRDRVVYASGPDSLGPMLSHIHRGGTGGQASSIVVVDDCGYSEQVGVWDSAKSSSRMRLVSIDSEEIEGADGTEHMGVPMLSDAKLREILSAYAGTGADTGAWAEYCRGSPRAAHVAGANLRDNPGDALRDPDTVAVWDRHIAGQGDPRGSEFDARKTALEWLSLFKAFGYGGTYGRELDRIAALVEESAQMPRDKFMSTIRDLRRMKVLQGTYMLHITPKMLHVYLWAEWWKNHPAEAAPYAGDLAGQCGAADESDRLLQRHLDMFRYASGSPESSKVVKGMLRPGDPLDSERTLRRGLNASFFAALSSVDPASALACIDRIVGRIGADFEAGMRRVDRRIPYALARMLSHADAFAGAMRLLLRLAVAGGGVGASQAYDPNPSLDAYCRALDPADAAVSAPYRARLAVVREAMVSDSPEARRVAVLACGNVLEMHRHSIAVPRCVGFEHMPEPWAPRDRGEAVGYYLDVFNLLKTAALDSRSAKLQEEAAATAVRTARQALLVPELSRPVVSLLEALAASGRVEKVPLLDQIARVLDMESDRISAEVPASLSSLRDSMEGTGFSAELRRHVGRHSLRGWGTGPHPDRAADAIQKLAGEAVLGDALLPELDWLVTDKAVNGLDFGHAVAERDPDLRMLGPLLAAMRRAGRAATALFLSGYLHQMAEDRRDALEDLLDKMLADDALCSHVPEITGRTGMTKRAAERIAQGVSDQRLGLESIQPLRYGHRLRGVPAEAVTGLVALVLEKCGQDEAAGATALDMLYSYFVAGPRAESAAAPRMPERLALDVLLHKGLVDPADGAQPDHVVCGAWRDLASALARQGGGGALALAREMIDRFGDSVLLHAPGSEPPSSALAVVAVKRPREVWQMIAGRIVPPLDQGAFELLEWIGHGGWSKAVGADELMAALMPEILAWVGEDPDERAWRMSRHLPHVFSALRGFVARFGDREDVRDGLAANLMAGTYRGSLVSHYADKKKRAQQLAAGESDPNVLSFLRHYAEALEMRIEREAAVDERIPVGLV